MRLSFLRPDELTIARMMDSKRCLSSRWF